MNALTQRELENIFNDFLDDAYGDVMVGGYAYPTSKVLKDTDEVVYNEELNNWIDSSVSDEYLFEKDGEYYLDNPNENEGDEQWIQVTI